MLIDKMQQAQIIEDIFSSPQAVQQPQQNVNICLVNLKKYIKHKPSIICLLSINDNYRITDKLFKHNYKANMISKELINIYSKNIKLQLLMKYKTSIYLLKKIIQLDNFELILILLKM